MTESAGTILSPFDRFVIYIPTYENQVGALSQVLELRRQDALLTDPSWSSLRVVVSINGSTYETEKLEIAGAHVIQRPTNLGGDANIALGFVEATERDLLWVLSDNDPVSPNALALINQVFFGEHIPDLLVGVSDEALVGTRQLRSPVTALGGSFHVGLISAVVYRWAAFLEASPAALQSLWTGWSQIALQETAVKMRAHTEAACVPLEDLVRMTRGDQTSQSVDRARRGYSHSFYGGALLGFLGAEFANENGRESVSRWWRQHWLFASAYRPRSSWTQRNFRADIVESLVRTGTWRDRLLWVLSLPPYWRVGLWLRDRGYRSRRWN